MKPLKLRLHTVSISRTRARRMPQFVIVQRLNSLRTLGTANMRLVTGAAEIVRSIPLVHMTYVTYVGLPTKSQAEASNQATGRDREHRSADRSLAREGSRRNEGRNARAIRGAASERCALADEARQTQAEAARVGATPASSERTADP
jgi:hypothetical protein